MAKKTAREAVALTARQSRFVDEYLHHGLASAAVMTSPEFTGEEPKSGYYVYLLINPITDRVIYVGKGIRNRSRQHAREARSGVVSNGAKYSAIREVHSQGKEIEIAYCPAESEAAAYKHERELISLLKEEGITNKVKGITSCGERTRLGAQYNLDRMKSREVWKRELHPGLHDTVIRVFGGLDECYDKIRNGFIELSQVPDDFNGTFSPSQLLEYQNGKTNQVQGGVRRAGPQTVLAGGDGC
jgi:hypothetical protein